MDIGSPDAFRLIDSAVTFRLSFAFADNFSERRCAIFVNGFAHMNLISAEPLRVPESRLTGCATHRFFSAHDGADGESCQPRHGSRSASTFHAIRIFD